MPDDTRDLAAVVARLKAATIPPGRDCREDITNAIAAVEAALEGANA